MGLSTDMAQFPSTYNGKSRHCGLDPQSQGLAYATPYQVRGDILEIQSPSKVRLSWIIASRFAVVHSICLRKLTFTLLRVTSAFLLFVQSAYAKSVFVQFGLVNFQPNCHHEFFTLYLLACSYYSKLKAFTPQGLTRM